MFVFRNEWWKQTNWYNFFQFFQNCTTASLNYFKAAWVFKKYCANQVFFVQFHQISHATHISWFLLNMRINAFQFFIFSKFGIISNGMNQNLQNNPWTCWYYCKFCHNREQMSHFKSLFVELSETEWYLNGVLEISNKRRKIGILNNFPKTSRVYIIHFFKKQPKSSLHICLWTLFCWKTVQYLHCYQS